MKTLKTTAIAITLIGLASCGESKHIVIFKKNTISSNSSTKVDQGGSVKYEDSLFIYKTYQIVEGTLTLKNDVPTITIKDRAIHEFSKKIRAYKKLQPTSETQHLNIDTKTFTYNLDTLKYNFRYGSNSFVFQGLTIPLKFRRKAFNNDSFPATTETGFSPSLAAGWKFNYNVVKSKEDIFGKKTRQYSITPGAFIGLSATDLSKTTTRDPAIVFPRKAPVFSAGFFLMLGYNNINFGYSIGVDHAQGPGKGSWVYRGKIWHGLTIGFDIIKN